MAVQVGDKVKLTSHQPSHPWTERLVGEEGRVAEKKDGAIAVSFSMLEGVLWFSPSKLELVKEKAA